jgi:hypothetical protein
MLAIVNSRIKANGNVLMQADSPSNSFEANVAP